MGQILKSPLTVWDLGTVLGEHGSVPSPCYGGVLGTPTLCPRVSQESADLTGMQIEHRSPAGVASVAMEHTQHPKFLGQEKMKKKR